MTTAQLLLIRRLSALETVVYKLIRSTGKSPVEALQLTLRVLGR